MTLTEDKTIFEELLDNNDAQKRKNRVDKAYQLMTVGRWKDAEELFRSVIEEDPDNADAAVGLRIISRQDELTRRDDILGAKAYKLSSGVRQETKKPINVRMLVWVILIFALLCAGIYAASSGGALWFLHPDVTAPVVSSSPVPETAEPTPTETPAPTETPTPTESALPIESTAPTEAPTHTDAPVNTPTPTKTPVNTPAPVKTPAPEKTPKPTAKPTQPPAPTKEPTPTTDPRPTPPQPPAPEPDM